MSERMSGKRRWIDVRSFIGLVPSYEITLLLVGHRWLATRELSFSLRRILDRVGIGPDKDIVAIGSGECIDCWKD